MIEKLAALIPPPRANLVRYHGVLAPAARDRAAVVPQGSPSHDDASHPGCSGNADAEVSRSARPHDAPDGSATAADPVTESRSPTAPRPRSHLRRYSWPELMQRVFAIDVLECPDCGGAMRILAAIHPPHTTKAILDCLGLPSRPPPIADASPDLHPEAIPDLDDLEPAVSA